MLNRGPGPPSGPVEGSRPPLVGFLPTALRAGACVFARIPARSRQSSSKDRMIGATLINPSLEPFEVGFANPRRRRTASADFRFAKIGALKKEPR